MKSTEEKRDYARPGKFAPRFWGAIRPKLRSREVNREGQHGSFLSAVFCVDSVLLFPRM